MPKNNKKLSKPTKALAVTPQYIETQKFKDWCKYFFDRSNKETYGNATKSALSVYNTENYWSAATIGHDNLKKLQNLRLAFADNEGFGFGDMMRIGFSKMLQGEFEDWDKMMVRLGHFEPDVKSIQPMQNNFQFNFTTMGDAIVADRKARGLAV